MELNKAELEALQDIFQKSRVSEDRFKKGIKFVQTILAGTDKMSAYEEIFDAKLEETEIVRNKTWNLWRAKWIQEIVKILKVEARDNFEGLANLIVQEAIKILKNKVATPTEKAQAAKVLQPYALIQEQKELQEQSNVYVINLIGQVQALTEQGKLIEGVVIE